MSKVTMLTVVPVSLAADLSNKKRVRDYNTLPQINKTALEIIRGYISEKIGYDDLPMACLRKPSNTSGSAVDVMNYLPLNSKNSVLFVLEMPDDMIVSVDFSKLISISSELAEAESDNDTDEIEFLSDSLRESLTLGIDDNSGNYISFIPFLDYSRCRFFATLNADFSTSQKLDLPGVEEMSLRELSAFTN